MWLDIEQADVSRNRRRRAVSSKAVQES